PQPYETPRISDTAARRHKYLSQRADPRRPGPARGLSDAEVADQGCSFAPPDLTTDRPCAAFGPSLSPSSFTSTTRALPTDSCRANEADNRLSGPRPGHRLRAPTITSLSIARLAATLIRLAAARKPSSMHRAPLSIRPSLLLRTSESSTTGFSLP